MANREELNKEAAAAGLENPEQYETKAELQTALDKHVASETTPAEQAEVDIDKSGAQGTDLDGSTVNENDDPSAPDAKSDGSNREDQTVAAQADGIDGVDRDHTPAGTLDEANAVDGVADRLTPPVAANPLSPEATDEAAAANTDVVPAVDSAVANREAEDEDNQAKVDANVAGSKEVDTKLGSSEEEAAAARSGVQVERLSDPKQNREPKNRFEQSNQKVTEVERQAAQEVSDMTTADRVENAPTPAEAAQTDAAQSAQVNGNADIAAAIAAGFQKAANGKDDFTLEADAGVEPRFTLVRNASGEVLLRENETGHLSRIQLESIEEKEASVQGQEVTEL